LNFHSDSLYHVTLYTLGRKPLLEGEVPGWVGQALRNLPGRYPGLKVLAFQIHPDRVEMALDLHRLDEDLARILQTFKAEVKGLVRKKGSGIASFWEWAYHEREILGTEIFLDKQRSNP
jgi:REP element-mobilizing transposase RayT